MYVCKLYVIRIIGLSSEKIETPTEPRCRFSMHVEGQILFS